MADNFEVLSTRIVEQAGGKKYVAYAILVKSPTDIAPVIIERRYTDFSELFNSIRHDSGNVMASITFPKKLILGNFSASVIAARSSSFENILKFILRNERLCNNPGLRTFLVGPEEREGIKLLEQGRFSYAKPLLIKVFSVLNKIYTDRHPAVLMALCRLAACCNADPHALVEAEKYGELALRRFETVSDVDLLRYYVPLLQMCVHLWWTLGRDKKLLEARLSDLRRQGHRVDGCPKLLDALMTKE